MIANINKFSLPENVEFCTKCVISNQRPSTVIELKHNQVDYAEEGKVILETIQEDPPKEKKERNRCQFIKGNGKQCRQTGKESQSGGPIIDGYCRYHRPETISKPK